MSGINYELNIVDFPPLLFSFPFSFSSLGLQVKESSFVRDFSFEKSQRNTDTVISPAEPGRGGRAGCLERRAQALASVPLAAWALGQLGERGGQKESSAYLPPFSLAPPFSPFAIFLSLVLFQFVYGWRK